MTALNTELLNALLWLQSQPQGITFVDLNKGEPQITFFSFILVAFKFIGIALLAAGTIGALIGLFRIWVRRRFPENRLNGIDVEPLTFLHLNENSEADL
jgi:hypothetical protein